MTAVVCMLKYPFVEITVGVCLVKRLWVCVLLCFFYIGFVYCPNDCSCVYVEIPVCRNNCRCVSGKTTVGVYVVVVFLYRFCVLVQMTAVVCMLKYLFVEITVGVCLVKQLWVCMLCFFLYRFCVLSK